MKRMVQGCYVMAAGLLLLSAASVQAQQFVVDDANIVDVGACQFEAWVGESSSWLLPACRFLPRTELTLGVGWVPDNGSTAEWVAQAKVNLVELQPNSFGVAVVAGVGIDPLGQVVGSRLSGPYAYVPVSYSVGADRLVLHANVGWHYEDHEHDRGHDHHHDDEGAHHALTWGVRSDVALTPLFTLIGELFGEDRIRPEFQVGVRTTLIDDRLQFDISWGGHTARGFRGAGWALGLAWTPAPWF